MDLCLILFASWLLPLRDLEILTGEPLMLTKTFVLLTDLFTGGFCPVEVAGLMEGKVLEVPLLSRPERTGELRLLAGEKRRLDEGVFTAGNGVSDGEEDVEDCDFPPSRKPLPLNGIMFLMSCDPEPEREETNLESSNRISLW